MRFKKHIIRYGDTIQAIAQKYYNSTDNWLDLIKYNDLKYPYIVDSDDNKKANPNYLVSPGDEIIIPIYSNLEEVPVLNISNKDRDFLLELSLGKDLDITSDTKYYSNRGTSDEILALGDDKHGDLGTRTGIDNIRQQLQTRLLTPKGSLVLHPTYGSDLHRLFGKATPEQGVLIEIEITKTLLTDKRVTSVNTVTWKLENNLYEGVFDIVLRDIEESIRFVLQSDEQGSFALIE